MDEYLHSLEREAMHYQGAVIDAVYVGGGTPTYLNAEQLRRLFRIVRSQFRIKSDAEWTIEANPEQLDEEKLRAILSGGANRVSLGVQTFNDRYLKWLGRNHDARSARAAYERIKSAGFRNISVDLMFGFPDQRIDEVREDLAELLALESTHVSLYSLTLEPNSRFHTRGVAMPGGQEVAEQYMLIKETLERHGYLQYEISNFAKPGFICAHNVNYWRGGNYIGLGIGAHSHRDGRRAWNIDKLSEYIDLLTRGRSVEAGSEQLSENERRLERLLIGLRMNEGVEMETAETEMFDAGRLKRFDLMIKEGFLERDGRRLRATDKGRLVLDELSSQLV